MTSWQVGHTHVDNLKWPKASKLDFCFKQVSNGIHTFLNIKSWFLWLITKNANGSGGGGWNPSMDLKHMQGILSSWNAYVCDMYMLNIWIRIYSDYFIERQPARAAFQVSLILGLILGLIYDLILVSILGLILGLIQGLSLIQFIV